MYSDNKKGFCDNKKDPTRRVGVPMAVVVTVQEGRGGHMRVCRPILELGIPPWVAGTVIIGRTYGYVVAKDL